MLLNVSDVRFKLIAVIVALALVMPMVMMPVGAAQAQKVEEIGEVEIIKGKPTMVIEIDKILCEEKQVLLEEELGRELEDEIYIPLGLREKEKVTAIVNGQQTEVEIRGNAMLIPTERGKVAIPLNKFEVVKKGNEIAIVGEKKGLTVEVTANPIPLKVWAVLKTVAKITGVVMGCTAAVAQRVLNDHSAGRCACFLYCDAPTEDGPYGDWFCDYRMCLTGRVASWMGVD